MHLFYPPPPQKKKKFGLTIVFDFSCEDCNTQKKLEIMAMYKILGWEGAGESRYIMDSVARENFKVMKSFRDQ